MSYYSVDVESDGSIPGETDYSMVCFGIVLIDKDRQLDKTFYGQTAPISENFDPAALAISGFTREEHLQFPNPEQTMAEAKAWIESVNENKRPRFIADNNGYDYMFFHWYMEHFLGLHADPFSWSSTNIKDLHHGMMSNIYSSIHGLRRTAHTHHPVDDAKGNAEVFVTMVDMMGLKV